MIDFIKEAKSIKDDIVGWRRDFHMHPELGKCEVRTSEKCAQIMESLGIEVQRGVGVQYKGAAGILRGAFPGPTVALRADMDALPVTEARNVPYKSLEEGKMHACGHDVHMSIALGAAKILAKHKDKLKGNVKFIFQPNEEQEGGADSMIKDGVLDGVDVIFGLHDEPKRPAGTMMIGYDTVMAASDRLTLEFMGKSAHGAYPHFGVDAITMACQFVTAAQTLVSRETAPTDSAALSIGTINGGTARNVICDHVKMEAILRTLNPETRERLNGRVDELMAGIAHGMQGDYKLMRVRSYGATINDNRVVDYVRSVAADIIGKDKIIKQPFSNLGVEDFGFYLEKIPGAYWFLGTGNKEKDTEYPLHSPMFDVDEDALPIGSAIQAALAFNFAESSVL